MSARRHSAALVAIGVVLAAAFATVALRFLPAMNVRAVLADEPIVVGPAPQRLARRVVLVIIDGLRLDTSRDLPFLDRLRAIGVDGDAIAPWPTLSMPNYVTILAGLEPRWSGMRNNQRSMDVAVDSVPARLAAADLHAAFATDQRHAIRLFGRTWERTLPASTASRSEDLLVLVPAAVDAAGHATGGTSTAYRDAALRVDRSLASILDVDLARDAVVIVADHGHTARGGHGGTTDDVTHVPLILAGAGVRRGAVVRGARLTDVAPTIATLLGVAAPVHATGSTLVDALVLADPAPIVRADAERHARIAQTIATLEARQHAAITTARAWRIPVGAMVMILLIVFLVRTVRRGAAKIDHRALVAGVVFPVVFYVSVPVLPFGLVPSHSPGDSLSLVVELFGYLAVAAGAQLVAALLLVGRSAPRMTGSFAIGLVVTATPAIAIWALLPEAFAATLPSPAVFMLVPITAAAAATQAGSGAAVLGAILIGTRSSKGRDMVEAS